MSEAENDKGLLKALFFLSMKYFYQKPDIYIDIYGKTVTLDHPIYQKGTKISTDGKAIIIVQQRFINKTFFWDSVDPWIISDIYLNKNFPSFFSQYASENPPIFQVRKIMWALKMKPLPKEFWEDFTNY